MNLLWSEICKILTLFNESLLEVTTDWNEIDVFIEDIVPKFFQFWSASGTATPQLSSIYSKLCHEKYALDLMSNNGTFTTDILSMNEQVLDSFSAMIKDKNFELGLGKVLVESKLNTCYKILKDLKATLAAISPALVPVYNRLVEIRQDLISLLSRNSPNAFSLAQVQILQDELREIDDARIDGKYMSMDSTVVPGQAAVIFLLEQCYDDVQELLSMRDVIVAKNPLRGIYEQLIEIRKKLESAFGYGFIVKAEDLVPIQQELGEIDNLRVDGKFLDSEGEVPEGQACYRLVQKLQAMAEPVDESLMPVYNELMTIRRCFLELQKWKVTLDDAELCMYETKLLRIDRTRQDGKFIVEGQVPGGQGILHELLEECYELKRSFLLEED